MPLKTAAVKQATVKDSKRSNVVKYMCFICAKTCLKKCSDIGCNPCPQHIIKWRKKNMDKIKTALGTVKHIQAIHSESVYSKVFVSKASLANYPDAFKYNSNTKNFVGGKFNYTLWNSTHPLQKIVDIPCWCHSKPNSSQQKIMFQIGADLPSTETQNVDDDTNTMLTKNTNTGVPENTMVTENKSDTGVPDIESLFLDAGEPSFPTAEKSVIEGDDCDEVQLPIQTSQVDSTLQELSEGDQFKPENGMIAPSLLLAENSDCGRTCDFDSKPCEQDSASDDQFQPPVHTLTFDSSCQDLNHQNSSHVSLNSQDTPKPEAKLAPAKSNTPEHSDPATKRPIHESTVNLSKSCKRKHDDDTGLKDYVKNVHQICQSFDHSLNNSIVGFSVSDILDFLNVLYLRFLAEQ